MSAMRLVIILVILIGLGFLGMQITADTGDEDKLAVALDEATKTAIAKGEFTVPEGVTFVESKDCEQQGNWAMVGACLADGTAKYTQTYKENKPGGCPSSAKAKFMPCCYQKNDWTDKTGCNSVGRKTQQQTTAGNCPDSVKTKKVDCPYVGPWVKIGGCGSDGKQYYRRDVVNSGATTSKSENCCYEGPWKKGLVDGQHESMLIGEDANGNAVNGNSWYGSWSPNHWKKYSVENREIKNCPPGHPTEKRSYKCGRGSCRQYDKYWFWANNANLSKGRQGPCGSMYNCCERWEPCSEDSNDYIKGPKGTQGDYQYSYNL